MSGEHRPDETAALAERYARRGADDRYSLLQPDVWQTLQERQRAMLRLFVRLGYTDLSRLRVLEVGCGAGGNLLELLRLGFAPSHLAGAELLPQRLALARQVLPAAVTLWAGDASALDIAAGSQHIVLQSTVFSSLLDDAFQRQLADAMWRWWRRAVVCCGTTSPSTTRATRMCGACRWPGCRPCFRRQA